MKDISRGRGRLSGEERSLLRPRSPDALADDDDDHNEHGEQHEDAADRDGHHVACWSDGYWRRWSATATPATRAPSQG